MEDENIQAAPESTPEPAPAPESEPACAAEAAPDAEQGEAKEDEEKGLIYDLYYWLQTLVAAVTAIVLVFTFVGRISRVVGPSMLNTLHEGDLFLVHSLGYTPKAGDIVVLNKTTPETSAYLGGETIVKRVIATGGQQVEIDYSTSTVYVDGVPLDEPYVREPMLRKTAPHVQQTFFTVPEGCIFVLGDNRNESTDSRDDRLGMIDERYVLGHAVFVLFPFADLGAL